MDETSLSLLDRAQREADPEAWDRLVRLYAPLMKRWLLRYQVQDSDVDDLVQDVLAVVLRELPKFQHNRQPGAFRSWLRTILVYRLREFWRKQQRRPIATGDSDFLQRLDELADGASTISCLWATEHDEHVMRQLLDLVQPRVAPETWKAFLRQMMEGVPAGVVAQELGISVDSAYAAKSRILRMLRQEALGLID
jgi:RNA polymerase sigma-70 factor (ECF subfamily)